MNFRHRARKAIGTQSSNIQHHCRKNSGRCNKDVPGPEGHVENDTGSNGRNLVRNAYKYISIFADVLNFVSMYRLTNDGNAILREIDVAHPAAKNMIELSRTQDEECGDGTTSVIVLAASILASSLSQLERDIHPVVIISAYNKALREALAIIEKVAIPVNVEDEEQMLGIVKGALGTKFVSRWSELMCKLALDAVHIVAQNVQSDKSDSQYASTFSSATPTVDIKRYARIEKIPGGAIEESRVIRGIMLNKDITHPGMRRRIQNPRIVLLDCPLEYKKGESQTNMEFSKEGDWSRAQEVEEEVVKAMVEAVCQVGCDLVLTEKGVSGECAFNFPIYLRSGLISTRRPCPAPFPQTQCFLHQTCPKIR